MKEFKAGAGPISSYIRAVVGGKVSSGKTSFAATLPRPLFFGDISEGGFQTLDTMKNNPKLRSYWWDPNFEPTVWAMENMIEYRPAVDRLRTMIAQKKCPFQSLVFDSLSVYGKRVLRELRGGNPGRDGRQNYGDLEFAIDTLISEIHTLPLHVIWLCHVTDEYQLTVPGKATAAAWANMSHKWLVRADVQTGGTINYQLQTRPFRTATWLGGRGNVLPDPMIPSFKCLFPLLGLKDQPVSPTVPDFMGQEYPEGAVY
jgi:hypothetical protein